MVGNPRWYNVSNGFSNWTINVLDTGYSKATGLAQSAFKLASNTTSASIITSIYKATETAYAHFNVMSNMILFPINTWTTLTNQYKLQAKNLLTCNATGCWYPTLCTDILASISDLTIELTDSVTYIISAKNIMTDLPNGQCYFAIG